MLIANETTLNQGITSDGWIYRVSEIWVLVVAVEKFVFGMLNKAFFQIFALFDESIYIL